MFSPDGRWVIFTSERAGGADLYALELAAESPPIRLTRHRAFDDAAAFSPDGNRLAFVSSRDGDADIFVMPFAPDDPDAAEAAATNLTRRPGGDFNPAFSPDGRLIAFARQDSLWPTPGAPRMMLARYATNCDVYIMSADGGEPRRLTQPSATSGSPAWSEDGESIHYSRVDDEFYSGDYTDPKGVEVRRVSLDGTGDAVVAPFGLSPAVAPDGRIAFVRLRPSTGSPLASGRTLALMQGHVVSVAADGSGERPETDSGATFFAPAFERTSNRMVGHGPGPVETGTLVRFPDDFGDIPFAPSDARRHVELADRVVTVQGVLGSFPAVLPSGDIVYSAGSWGGPIKMVEKHRTADHDAAYSAVKQASNGIPLVVSRLDGSGAREIFSRPSAFLWGASVARDAGWIVAANGPPFAGGDALVDIWKLRLDGTEPRSLTSESSVNNALPNVSADGERIVFRRDDTQSRKVYVMDGEGRNLRRVSTGTGTETMPSLSPDGKWVVFSTTRVPTYKLWIQRLDGTEGRFLEPDRLDIPDTSMHPRFSPDGKWVVFTSDRGHMNDEFPLTFFPQPYGDLWAVPVAGGAAVRLTDNKWEDGPSDWAFMRPAASPR